MDFFHELRDAFKELVAHAQTTLRDLFPLLIRQPERLGKSNDARHVLGARSSLPFLPSAHALRLERCAAFDVKHAHALWSVELVRGQTHEVHAQRFHVEVQKAGGLYGVGVNYYRLLAALGLGLDDAGDLGDRLNSPDLVVGQHHADQYRLVGYSMPDLLGIDEAVFVHREVGHIKTELLKLMAAMQNGMVLDAGGDDVIAQVLQREGDPLESGVVRFGAAAGEHYLAHAGAKDARNGLSCVVGGLAGILSQCVNAGWIAVAV